jgi:co-chaperonin GroES (HSP10)
MAGHFAQEAGEIAEREFTKAGIAAARENAPGPISVTGTARPGGGIRVSAKGSNDSAAYARDYLVKKHGLSPIAAAAVAGHGMQESGFNLDAVGDAGTAYGAFQWRGDRLINLKRFAQSRGSDWKNLDAQLDFAVHEMATSETTAGEALRNATNIEEAVAAFMHFERPQGYTRDNPRGGHAFANRLAFAQGLAGREAGSTPAASVGPVTVTPVASEVQMTPGKPGAFRPRGGNTIADRAYDVAGTKTYLEELKFTMLQDQEAVYEAYRDDPVMLEKALGELETAHMKDHVLPEIEAEYSLDFRRMAFSKVQQAREEARSRQIAQDKFEFLDRVGQFKERKAQAVARAGMGDQGAHLVLASLQRDIESHYDSAAARGIFTPDEAETAKKKSHGETIVAVYSGQANGKRPEEIAAMRQEIYERWSRGEEPEIDQASMALIDENLRAAEKNRLTQDEVASKSLQQRGDDLVNKIARGQPVTAEERSRFELDIGTAPDGPKIVSSTYSRMRVADALRKRPIAEVEANLEKILRGDGGSFMPEDLDFAREKIKEYRQAILTDPLGQAEVAGIIAPVAPIPVDGTATPEQIAGAVAYRRGAAEAVAKHFGVPVRYFRPGEAEAVMRAAQENPEALVAFTMSVRDAFGPQAHMALAEFAETGPALAHAAGLSIATGDVGIARDVATTLTMKQQKQLPDLTPETARKINGIGAAAVAGVFVADPRTQNAALQTAQLLFEQEAARMGLDPAEVKTEGSPSQTAYLKTLDRALGGRTVNGEGYGGLDDVNGMRVVIPADMRKGAPQELIYGLTDAQLAKLPPISSGSDYPIRASQIRRGFLVSAGDGRYRVSLNDPMGEEPEYLVDDKGGYWTLDIRQLRDVAGDMPGVSANGYMSQRDRGWDPEE